MMENGHPGQIISCGDVRFYGRGAHWLGKDYYCAQMRKRWGIFGDLLVRGEIYFKREPMFRFGP
jgi:hypothetical protein